MEQELLEIIDHFGIETQQRKLQEELFELQQAITIFEQSNNQSCDNIAEELVDVIVLLKQFICHYNLNKHHLNKIEIHKIKRTLQRIESGYYE